ncbi:MAG: 2-hydroxyglutaryl-CoA dehydratase, partial [Ammonifex sp.]
FSDLAATARKAAPISSVCTVFAESEVVALISQAAPREEIALGLCKAVVDRVAALIYRVGLVEGVAMTGGVAKMKSVVAGISAKLGVKVYVPPEPQIIGALGAALIAQDLVLKPKKRP